MNVKRVFVQIFITVIIVFISGCGKSSDKLDNGSKGETSKNNETDKSSGNGISSSGGVSSANKFLFNKISIAGSSITHGNIENSNNDGEGYLGELSYVGEVEKYFRENMADTVNPNELRGADDEILNRMCYMGKMKVYYAGSEVSGRLAASKEIAIVFGGTNKTTRIQLEVDGENFTYTIPEGNYLPVKKTYDDTNVVFYKAFRQNNPKAVKIWQLKSDKEHTFRLKVLSGELRLNFITNHMYYFQNAGVGGYEANNFLNTTRAHSNLKDIVAFDPDLFIFESSTNDAKTWAKDHDQTDGEVSTNQWIVEDPVSFSSQGKKITLGQSVTVQKGDIVVMGEYNGDIQNMVVGIVSADSNGRDISLSKIVSYAGQKVSEVSSVPQNIVKKCRIKSIRVWEDRVRQVVQQLENGVGHAVTVGIGTSGVPNYYDPKVNVSGMPRRLLGYREKGNILAEENDWFFADFFQKTLQVEPGVDTNHKWSYGDNTHPNEKGRVLFGEAIIDAMVPYLK